jgi:antitoxin YefM
MKKKEILIKYVYLYVNHFEMEVINYSSLRENLKQVLDSVVDDKAHYIVSRGKESAIIMSLEEFNGWKETLYLLSSKNNRDRLLKAVARDKKGKSISNELIYE